MSSYNFLRTLILPIDLIDSYLPKKGKIVDLGCGQGLIATFLAGEKEREVEGVDINGDRIPKSNKKNLKFKKSDIRNYKLVKVEGVVISDVLHHLSREDQDKVLENISKSLKTGKTLIIKEIDTGEFFRSKLSRFWDLVFYPKEEIAFSNAKVLKKKLEKLKFKVDIQRTTRLFPGSTTLFICTKS